MQVASASCYPMQGAEQHQGYSARGAHDIPKRPVWQENEKA